MLLLNILGFIFLVIIILLVLIILVPFSYMIKSDSIENEVEIFIIWMFGLLGLSYIKKFSKEDEVYLRIFNIPKKIKISDNKVEKLEKVKKDKNSEKKEIDLKKHFNRKVLNKIISSLKKVWRKTKPKKIMVNVKFGFNDPMNTGILYALYCQFSYLFRNYDVNLQPSFDEEGIRGNYLVRGNIWIFYLLMVLLEFLFSAPIRNEIISIMKMRGGAKHVR